MSPAVSFAIYVVLVIAFIAMVITAIVLNAKSSFGDRQPDAPNTQQDEQIAWIARAESGRA